MLTGHSESIFLRKQTSMCCFLLSVLLIRLGPIAVISHCSPLFHLLFSYLFLIPFSFICLQNHLYFFQIQENYPVKCLRHFLFIQRKTLNENLKLVFKVFAILFHSSDTSESYKVEKDPSFGLPLCSDSASHRVLSMLHHDCDMLVQSLLCGLQTPLEKGHCLTMLHNPLQAESFSHRKYTQKFFGKRGC